MEVKWLQLWLILGCFVKTVYVSICRIGRETKKPARCRRIELCIFYLRGSSIFNFPWEVLKHEGGEKPLQI